MEIIAICQHLNLIIPFIANISLTTKIKRTLLTKRDAAIYVFYFQILHRAVQTYQEHIYITCGWNF